MEETKQPYTREKVMDNLYHQTSEMIRHLFGEGELGWFESDRKTTIKMLEAIINDVCPNRTDNDWRSKANELCQALQKFECDHYKKLNEGDQKKYIEAAGSKYIELIRYLLKDYCQKEKLDDVLKKKFTTYKTIPGKKRECGRVINTEIKIPDNLTT